MIGREIVYVAERARSSYSSPDGVRIVKDVEGPHYDLYPEDKKLIATLSEDQAERLRDSIDEVLNGGRSE